MIAIAPHHLIISPYNPIRLLDIVKIGVGYCFSTLKAMREASLQDKTIEFPHLCFYLLSSGNWLAQN